MRIGWLGLGAMGAPMAGCLARAGHSVVAYDIVPGRAAALAGGGIQAADSISGAVRDAGIAAIMVATPDQVDQVLFGPGGAAGSLEGGAVVMIMATVGPEVVAEVTTRLGRSGVTVVDARERFATRTRFPDVDELIVAWPDEALERLRIDRAEMHSG